MTTFDGGVISGESMGRGNTYTSYPGSPASGSENPAALITPQPSGMYATALVDHSSNLDEEIVDQNDPLRGKVLQYLAFIGEKGSIFYEPIARKRERQITDASSPSDNYRDVEYAANAIGLAAADRWGRGSFGFSMAFLWSSQFVDEKKTGVPDKATSDTGTGVRVNLGYQIPTGPALWGISVQNGPGFIWSKDYEREMLPVRVRIGNTTRIGSQLAIALETEERFYNEGSDDKTFFFAGTEYFPSRKLKVRAGIFGEHLDLPKYRHVTAGLTYLLKGGYALTYAYETFELQNEKVKKSYVSLQMPLSQDK